MVGLGNLQVVSAPEAPKTFGGFLLYLCLCRWGPWYFLGGWLVVWVLLIVDIDWWEWAIISSLIHKVLVGFYRNLSSLSFDKHERGPL